jgi:hypothetical protein
MNIITTSLQVGTRSLHLSPTIQQWLASHPRNWDAEGILIDLRNLAEGCRWDGRRRRVGIPYSRKDIMDRLDVFQARYPRLNFFSGVFPRIKGQPCTQILWYDATHMGTEDELE